MGKSTSQFAAHTPTGPELVLLSKPSASVTISAATISAQASDSSFNDSGDGFIAAGFAVGMRVKVDGFTGDTDNNLHGAEIAKLAAGKMTIAAPEGALMVDDAAGESVTITAWESVRATAQDVADLAAGIGGSTGSTDNALLRADGPGGATAQASGVLVTDNDEISGYRAHINAQTGTSYTFVAGDAGKIVTFDNAGAITVDLPNSLPAGWSCTWMQKGAGVVTFDPASGATLNNRQNHTDSAGQWAEGALHVDSNSGGSSAVYVLGGDTA
jgi:hypothetical protein